VKEQVPGVEELDVVGPGNEREQMRGFFAALRMTSKEEAGPLWG
jgi:hypothetical protein